jgi:hypothetical protein
MDKNLKKKPTFGASPSTDDCDLNDSPEVDKRLAMYKRLRQELAEEEGRDKALGQDRKMQEISGKIDKLEHAKREKVQKEEV